MFSGNFEIYCSRNLQWVSTLDFFFFSFNSIAVDTHKCHWELCSHLEITDSKILFPLFTLSVRHIRTSTNTFQSLLIYFELILTDISNCSQVPSHHLTLKFNTNDTICQILLLNLLNLIKQTNKKQLSFASLFLGKVLVV